MRRPSAHSFAPADGRVYQVAYPTGTLTEIASGFSSMTDVEFGPGGQLYALNFGDQNPTMSEDAPPWSFGSGKVFKLDAATGTLTPIVTGFTFTTAIIFSGDTAYVANNGITIPGLNDGEIWKIDNVSSLQPLPTEPAPQPTAAPTQAPVATPTRTGVTPPNTGTGGDNGGVASLTWLVLAGLALAGTAVAGGALALKKR